MDGEEAARLSPESLLKSLDAAPEATLVIGRDYRVLFANLAARELAGGQDPVAACMTCYEVAHGRTLPCKGIVEPCPLGEVVASREAVKVFHTHCGARGRKQVVEVTATPVFDEAGNIVRIVEMCRDVGDRARTVDLRLAYDELEAERRRLYDVLNMIPAFVYLRGPDYRIRFANRQFQEEFGIHEGRACHEILHGRSDPCPACVASDVLATGEGRAQEMTFVNGRTYELHDYPFVDADGSELILRLGVDVTERRRLEREVAEASRMEQRRIGQDLHDTLGQELAGIAFQSKALAMKLARGSGEGAEEAQLISETVRRAIDHARAMARGLCPVETGAQGLMTALDELATSTRKLYGLDCVFECPAPVRIADHAVATHAYQIAREAVTNAVRHGKPKKVAIRLAGADGMVRLEVSDDGTGMAKDMTEDAGMGLRIMKHRAAVIGGALDVQTAPREGTTVTCVFRPPAVKPSGS